MVSYRPRVAHLHVDRKVLKRMPYDKILYENKSHIKIIFVIKQQKL